MSEPCIEDLYEVGPIEIEMVGGCYDGRRMFVPDNRDAWLLPVPVNLSLGAPEPDVTRTSFNAVVYRWAASVRDDGTRVFRWSS